MVDMAFWSREKILENRNVIVEPPFDEDQIDCNAYALRMGSSFYCTADADKERVTEQKKTLLSDGACFLIPPGQFAFLLTKEIVHVPDDAMAFISMRTGIKLQGLINISGFHVDPGYRGRLIYAVYNASPSPIQICENDQIFKIWFCALDRRSKFLFDGDGYNDITSDLIKGMNKGILSLQSLADRLRDQTQTFAEQKQTIDTLHIIWRTIIIAAIIAVVSLLGTLFLTFTLPPIKQWGEHVFQSYRPIPTPTPTPPASSEKRTPNPTN
jgi:dCTP deaminase